MADLLSQSVSYYVARLIQQYRTQPKAQATIAILVKQAIMDMVIAQIGAAYNIDTSIGVQLDVIGKYVGLSRNIGPSAAVNYFGFRRYAGTGNIYGFARYAGGVNVGVIWNRYQYGGAQGSALNDTSYRTALKCKIMINSSDGTVPGIYALLHRYFFGVITLIDHHDMTITYLVSNTVPLDTSVLQTFLPKPMGVGITVTRY